jgi:hypothetical protein
VVVCIDARNVAQAGSVKPRMRELMSEAFASLSLGFIISAAHLSNSRDQDSISPTRGMSGASQKSLSKSEILRDNFGMESIKDLPVSVIIVVAIFCGYLLHAIMSRIIDRHLKRTDDHDKALQDNTMAIMELRVEIKNIREIISDHYKLRQDVNVLHERIRNLQKAGLNGSET